MLILGEQLGALRAAGWKFLKKLGLRIYYFENMAKVLANLNLQC